MLLHLPIDQLGRPALPIILRVATDTSQTLHILNESMIQVLSLLILLLLVPQGRICRYILLIFLLILPGTLNSLKKLLRLLFELTHFNMLYLICLRICNLLLDGEASFQNCVGIRRFFNILASDLSLQPSLIIVHLFSSE